MSGTKVVKFSLWQRADGWCKSVHKTTWITVHEHLLRNE